MRRLLILALLFFASAAEAAGFLEHVSGTPYKWRTFPIHYVVDQGTLGSIDNASATTLVQDALSRWSTVSIADVTFQLDGQNSEDITASNIDEYITIDTSGAPRNLKNQTTMIFDTDGSIIDGLLGSGNSSVVLGLASPGALDEASLTIETGLAILNGLDASSIQLEATLTHESGHMLNLEHTQMNFEEAINSNSADDSTIPTMFPILPDDPSVLLTLHQDDEFSLGYLYPSTAYSARGFVSGHLRRRTGEGVRGVVVYCRDKVDPKNKAVAWISDHVEGGEGEYLCGNLDNGNYNVTIEPIFLAINFFTPDPPFIVSEAYSGSTESFDPAIDPSSLSADEVPSDVGVTQGSTASDIDIVLNEDGRLVSGEMVSGTSDAFFPALEYFITVPPGATSATFDLVGANPDLDLDIMGRCDGEFSLPFDSTAPPLTDNPGNPQQADFSSESVSGVESITLNNTTTPKFQNCTYHILVTNFSGKSGLKYDFTATVKGGDPRLLVEKGSGSVVSDGSGEILVMSRKLTAKEENFRLRSLVVADEGIADLAGVSQATLYIDTDGDGAATSADTVLATASAIDTTARTISFSGFDHFIDADASSTFLVTYTTESSAGAPIWGAVVLIGAWLGRRRRRWLTMTILGVSLLQASCGSKKVVGFSPQISKSEDVGAVGRTYGSAIKIDFKDQSKSVKDFFN